MTDRLLDAGEVAINLLIAEVCAAELSGSRGARLVQLQRPFVKADDEAEAA